MMIMELLDSVWETRKVPPKKGNLKRWHGVALLEVVGKVVARVIQDRLQKLAETQLPESQCGFRKGRSCTDMTFTVRQLVEKAFEYRAKQFLVFMDLQKAYDSVPLRGLQMVHQKLGAPKVLSGHN